MPASPRWPPGPPGTSSAGGRPAALVLEGDVGHPADYESVARLDEGGYRQLLDRHPCEAERLHAEVDVVGTDWLVSYGCLRDSPGGASVALLARHDVAVARRGRTP